jgi:signal transduction histidine kinase
MDPTGRGYHDPVASGLHAHARRSAIWVAWLRVAVLALVVLHVALTAGDLASGGLLAAAIAACAVLAASASIDLAASRIDSLARRSRALAVGLGAADLVALATIARVTVDIDATASIVWSFLLWVPFSVAMRAGTSGAVAATLATSASVLVASVLDIGALGEVSMRWTMLAVPALLTLVGGLAMAAATLVQRRSDIAVWRQLDDERTRTTRLREADALKNTFLAAVSHELRSPLTSILGFSLTLLDRHDLDESQRERMLRTIVLEAEHLEDILANLLDLDRLTRGKATLVPVELDPAPVIRAAVEHVRRRSGRHIDLQLADDLRVSLDAAQVGRIVENLAGNAVKYTPVDAEIRVEMRRERHGILIRVDDSGPGIGSELRDAIFEPFRRGSDRGVPGTGIGLSLVEQFSRMHGGKAWLEERPGGGCRFQVYLPSVRQQGSRRIERGGSGRVDAHRHVPVAATDTAD